MFVVWFFVRFFVKIWQSEMIVRKLQKFSRVIFQIKYILENILKNHSGNFKQKIFCGP